MKKLSLRAQVHLRWVISLIIGFVVGAAIAPALGLAAGLLAGWAALALVSAVWTIATVWGMDAEATRNHATAEDPGRRTARLIAVTGSVASLAAVLVVVTQARRADGAETFALAGIAVLSVVASWVLIHTNYMLRYAVLYYQGDAGGINFNQSDDPEYTDFIYFAVGLGMTYQVADTNVGSNSIRRVVIAQTMLGYLFGAGILATVINLVTSLG